MKQVDFDFRVYPVGNTEGNYNHQQLSDEIRTQYLEKGWEVLKTEISQVTGQVIYLAVSFVKYETPATPEASVSTEQAVDAFRRGPGRPKKVEEVAPA